MSTLYVKDFGAIGDGITNDRDSIAKAIAALKEAPAGSTLVFEADKTYYCGAESEGMALICLHDCNIKGDNTTITVDAPAKYFESAHCVNFTLEGFNFTYRRKPFAFSKEILEVNPEELTAVMTLDRSLNITETYIAPTIEFFSLVSRQDGRYHMSITQIEIVDAEKFTYKFTFNRTFVEIEKRVSMLPEYGMIVPMPRVGHLVELACTSLCNRDVVFKNCNLWSACKFTFFLRDNEGTVTFDNFNIVPDPNDNGGKNNIVTWRDGFHCKENRGKLIWKNCKLTGMYDDVFNISCSMLRVLKVEGEGKNQKISFRWPETNGPYNFIKLGDTLTIYHRELGKLIGKGIVTWVEGDTVVLDREIKGILPEQQVAVNSLVAPGSEIFNCDIQGTIRFRGPVYVHDNKIHCNRMWLAFEQDGFEGPLAENQLFENCDFTFDTEDEPYIEIYSGNPMKEAILSGEFPKEAAFHVDNIVFKNCKINKNCVSVGDVDALYEGCVRFE